MAGDIDDQQGRRKLADRVNARLAELGMSIAEAARRSDVSRTKWTQVSHASGPVPRRATLGQMARVLEIDAGELLVAAGYGTPDLVLIDGDGRQSIVQVKTSAAVHVDANVLMQLVGEIGSRLDRIEEQVRQMSDELHDLAPASRHRPRPATPAGDPRS